YIHARLLLPAVFGFCAPIAVVPVTRRYVAAVALAPWVVACAFVMRPPEAPPAAAIQLPHKSGVVTTDDYGWGDGGPNVAWYDGPGYYMQTKGLPPDYERVGIPLARDVHRPIGAIAGIGRVGYAMGNDFEILDTFGLADPLTAHLMTKPSTGF